MSSLLHRAEKIRRASSTLLIDGAEIVFDKSSGISEEDQRDILTQIQAVASRNRIQSSQDIFAIKARKRGLLFPLAVNVSAGLVLAAGLVMLSHSFRQTESRIAGGAGVIRSAEGRLIQEIKREAAARLQEKDLEIGSIQVRLEEIDRERVELRSTMDERIRQKEIELRMALERELAAERARLGGEGLSQAVIDERLRTLEAEKRTASEAQLAAFRTEAEAERLRMEASLQLMQSDFQRSLASLAQERRQIEQDSQQRESLMRSQLEERTRALEAERGRAGDAQAEIRRLSEQRERAALIDNQILGFYSKLREQLGARAYDAALATLTGLRAYLNEESILTLQSIQRRREVDLFIIENFTTMIREEQRRAGDATKVANLLRMESLLQDIRSATAAAEAELAAGSIDRAEAHYARALSMIPEILKSHSYFVDKAARLERERLAGLQAEIERAEAAFRAAAWQEAAAAYARALTYLPPVEGRDNIAARLQHSGFELATRSRAANESRAAAPLLSRAAAALERREYDEAILQYTDLLGRFPLSSQAAAALAGIRRAGAESRSAADRAEAEARQLLAAAERRLENERAAHAAIEQERHASESALRDRVSDLEKSLAAIQAAGQAVARGGDSAALPAAGTRTEAESPAAAEAVLRGMRRAYQDFTDKEARILATRGQAGIAEAKYHLDAFLASEEMRRQFPGLWDRIKRYDRAFQAAGRDTALIESADLVQRLASRPAGERRRILDQEIARRGNDDASLAFLRELRRLLS